MTMPKPIYEKYILDALELGRAVVECADTRDARNAAQGLCMIRRMKGYDVVISQRGRAVIVTRR